MSFVPLRPLFEQILRSRQAGLMAEANELCARILQAQPSSADDLYCQGSVLMQFGRIGEAVQHFDSAVQLGPATTELLVDRAVALAELGRLDEAVESCARALALNPGFAHGWFIHGDILREMGRTQEALDSFGKTLTLVPDFIAARANRAALLVMTRSLESALADYDRLVQLLPGNPDVLSDRGQVLGELFRFEEALEDSDRALVIQPRHVKALTNRGVTLWNMQRFEEALASYDRALALNPGLAIAMTNRANTLQDLLRLDEAMTAHDRVVALHPDYASGHWNRSQCLLLMERYAEGFAQFEWRKRRPESAGNYLSAIQPEWLGADDLAGKTLLIRAEQGLGDTLHYCRYAALAREKGARVILAVQKPLIRLMRGLVPPVDEIVGENDELPPFDHHIAMMSLPLAFGPALDNIPAAPYLRPEPALVERWAARLGGAGFKIGISWRGGGRGGADVGRSFAPRQLEALSQLPGVRLISLQKSAVEQLADLPPGMKVETLEDFDEGQDAFVDTAAVMENLDLVISSDTAVAHLAGALGRPTWLALKRVAEWRWRLQGETSRWYPTMRLFRQQEVGQWDSVFAAMQAELARRLAR